jgi:putative ABC transport system permease protein
LSLAIIAAISRGMIVPLIGRVASLPDSMDTLLQDIRYAARKLLRTPAFTVIALATLSLAIGATTAIFSIVNGVLLKPLPFANPSELVRIGMLGRDAKMGNLSAPDFFDYRNQNHSFVAVAPFRDGESANLSVEGSEPSRLNAAIVGATFFNVLGVKMNLGRGFIPGEDEKGAQRVAVISDKLWRSVFNGDARIVGRPISLNGEIYKVIGVAPRSLTYPDNPDVWMPFVFEPWMVDPENRGAHFFSAIARMRPGVTLDAAKRDMQTIGGRLQAEYPQSNTNLSGAAELLQTTITGDVKRALYTMFGAVGLVLLIACANVANLLLVRASGRETEIAVRTALGAGRGRIVQQLITESVMLSAAGAILGGLIASWSVDAIVAAGPQGLPRLENIVIDARVLAFSAALAIVTGLLFGLSPAIHSASAELGQMLKEGVRGVSGRRGAHRTRSMLVITEMALAVVLLVGAGLMIKSFVKLVHVDPGFQTEHIVTFDVSLPGKKYPFDRHLRRFATQVGQGLESLPGTQSVAVAFPRPLQPVGMRTSFDVVGRPPAPNDKRTTTDVRPASANFFSTMGIHVVRGRVFSKAEEDFGVPPVVVVTEAFVKKYFPNENPIGQRIKLGLAHDTSEAKESSVTMQGEIIGIVNDVRQRSLDRDPAPATYVGWGTYPLSSISFLVRSRAEAQTVAAGIRERVRAVDPELPIYDLKTMTDVVSQSVAQPRFYMILLTAFAVLALLLAALGIYGVISYSVSQRTRELGIRIALGATQDRVVRLVLGQGMALTSLGVLVGLVGAYWLVRLLASMLFGVTATDAPTFVAVSVVLLGVAGAASYLPARRASRVDPVTAMRAE